MMLVPAVSEAAAATPVVETMAMQLLPTPNAAAASATIEVAV